MKIRDLPSSLRKLQLGEAGNNPKNQQQNKIDTAHNGEVQNPARRSDAVVLQTAVKAESADRSDVEREQKVQDIKNRVKKGTYRPEVRATAAALVRDLGL